MSDRRQDSAKGLEAHGDVQKMSSKEEVVEVSKDGHGGVPDQIQEVLQERKGCSFVTNDGFLCFTYLYIFHRACTKCCCEIYRFNFFNFGIWILDINKALLPLFYGEEGRGTCSKGPPVLVKVHVALYSQQDM